MDPKKDIWQQFREQPDAWDEAPPASAWDKLNARLDAEPPSHPGRPWKPFALPGAGLVLILLLGFGLLRTALNEPEMILSDLSAVETVETSEPIHALDPAELPPPPHLDTLAEWSEAMGDTTLTANEDLDPVDMDYVQSIQPFEGDVEGHLSDPQDQGYGQVQDYPQLPYVQWDSMLPADNYSPYNYDSSTLNPGQMVVTNGFGNVLDTVRSLGQYRGGVRQGSYNPHDNQYLQLNMARNDISYSPRGRRGDVALLDHFNWILGSWKREGPSGATFEQWRQLDEFTIEGRGYFTVNGDTMVAEKMRIEQRGENVYYIVALDTNLRPIKFRLRSRNPGELIFENKKNSFPKEIIVRQTDADNFSTTWNDGKRSPRKRKEEVRRMQRAIDNSR